MDVLTVVVPIALLSLLIVLHECGHYLVARGCGIRIERFRLGFGPVIFERTSQVTGTTLRIGLIPFGAFVRIHGMDDAASDPDDRRAFPNRPIWQRLATILAGPAASYLVVVATGMALYACHGIDGPRRYGVGQVLDGYDATHKLQPGDVIVAIDHTPASIGSGPTLSERINRANGAPVTLTIERGGEQRDIALAPTRGPGAAGAPSWRIGVQLEIRSAAIPIEILDAARRAFAYPVELTRILGARLYRIVVGSEPADPGGPVRIVEGSPPPPAIGIVHVLELAMLLGVYVGLFLALPIPSFDGGRLVLLIYRGVTRRRSAVTR
jgi:regulator of sigma E protease